MGVGLNVSCACSGTFVLQVGPRIMPPRYELFPFMCASCRATSCLDIYAEALACAHCGAATLVPYGSAPALGTRGDNVVFACSPTARFSADDLTLTDGTYWCPSCRTHGVRFSDAGLLWD